MKNQWSLILALIFALIVAIFAVVNVDAVSVNYIFGTAQWPLILVIIGSALMGGIIVGSVGLFRLYLLQRKLKAANRDKQKLEEKLQQLEADKVETEDNVPLVDKEESHIEEPFSDKSKDEQEEKK